MAGHPRNDRRRLAHSHTCEVRIGGGPAADLQQVFQQFFFWVRSAHEGLTSAVGIISRDITRHPLRFVTAWRPGRHYPRYTIKKVRTRKSNDIVPAATRLHLLPLPATPGSQQPNAPPAA